MLTDFGRAKVIGEFGFDTQSLAGCAAYTAPELLSTDGNVNVDVLFSKKSDVYAYGMLCQKVRIQLILSIEKNSQDSRYSLEKTLSLGIGEDTDTKSSPLFWKIGGHSAQVRYPQICGVSWKGVGLSYQAAGLRLRKSSNSWVSEGYIYLFQRDLECPLLRRISNSCEEVMGSVDRLMFPIIRNSNHS